MQRLVIPDSVEHRHQSTERPRLAPDWHQTGTGSIYGASLADFKQRETAKSRPASELVLAGLNLSDELATTPSDLEY